MTKQLIKACSVFVLALSQVSCEGRIVEQTASFFFDLEYTLNLVGEEVYIDRVTGSEVGNALDLDDDPRTIKSVNIEGLSGEFQINTDASKSSRAITWNAFLESVDGGRDALTGNGRMEQPLLGWGGINVAAVGVFSSVGRQKLIDRLEAAFEGGHNLPMVVGVIAESEGGAFVATLKLRLWGTMVYETCEEVPNNPLIPFENDKPCVVGDI